MATNTNTTNHIFDETEALWLFRERQRNLQELSAFELAWKIWLNVLLSGKYHDIKSDLLTGISKTEPVVMKLINRLEITKPVKELVKKSATGIRNQLIVWFFYNKVHMLYRRPITLYTCHVKHVAFKRNGDCDYRESARKMIQANQFNKRINFEILCRFCLEDELKKIPVDEIRKFASKITVERCPLAWYWMCTLTQKQAELDRMSRYYDSYFDDFCCLEGVMIMSKDVDNWDSVGWFWRHLCDENDQMRRAARVLRDINKNWFLNEFYWKMNETQWQYIFTTIPVEILFVFFRQYRQFDKGFCIWERLKHTLTGDEFVDLMQRVFYEKKETGWNMPTAMKLWDTATDEFKRHVFHSKNSLVVDNFFEIEFVRQYDKNLKFLFGLLSVASIDYRKDMILKHGDVLFESDDFSKIDEIVEVCLPETDQLVKFKLFLSKSTVIKERCTELLANGKFDQLDKFFQHYSPDKSSAKNAKKELLNSYKKPFKCFIYEPNIWSKLEKFIDDVDTNEAFRKDAKKRCILACIIDSFPNWVDVKQLSQMKKITGRFLNEKEMEEFKTTFLVVMFGALINFLVWYMCNDGKYFSFKFTEELLPWIYDNNKELLKTWRLSINFFEVFLNAIMGLLAVIRCENIQLLDEDEKAYAMIMPEHELDEKIFVALDQYVIICFSGDIKIAKKFKLDVIFCVDDEYNDLQRQRFLEQLNSTAIVDDRGVFMLLSWFFDNDQEQMQKFKTQCKYEAISNAITVVDD